VIHGATAKSAIPPVLKQSKLLTDQVLERYGRVAKAIAVHCRVTLCNVYVSIATVYLICM